MWFILFFLLLLIVHSVYSLVLVSQTVQGKKVEKLKNELYTVSPTTGKKYLKKS